MVASLREAERRQREEDERGFNSVVKECRGKLIAIVGDFNKGKTWIVDKLTFVKENHPDESSVLPDGFQLSTPGLCAKRVEINGAYLMFVDTAGKNQSIPMADAGEFNAAFKEETLQRTLLSELCPNILMVIGKMSRTEQRTMRELCESLKRMKHKRQGFSPMLFVVHNWKEVTDKPLFDYAIEEVCSLLGVTDNVGGDVARVSRAPNTHFCLFEKTDASLDDADPDSLRQLKRNYGQCKQRGDVDGAEKHACDLSKKNITIRHGVVTKSVGQYVHLQWETGLTETCTHDSFLKLCRDKTIAQTSQEKSTFVRANRTVKEGFYESSVPIIEGKFDDIDVRHYFLANDICDFGRSYNVDAFPVIRTSLQEAAVFTTTPGLPMGFLNYMAEFRGAMERVAPRFFKTLQDEGGKASDFRLTMEAEENQVEPTDHIAKYLGLEDESIADCSRQKLLEDHPENFYDVVIRPYPTKDFRHLPGVGLELRLSKKFMGDESPNACNVFRIRLSPHAQFCPDINPVEPSTTHASSLTADDLGSSSRFIQINGRSCQYKILTTTELPAKDNAGEPLQRKRVIIDVPGCDDLAQSLKFDSELRSGGKCRDVHFRHGGAGTFEVRNQNLVKHSFLKDTNGWTEITQDEEVSKGDKGNVFPIGFGIDSGKTRIVQDRGVLVIDVTSLCDDDSDSDGS